MLWLQRGTISKRWLEFTCQLISMWACNARKMIVAVFRRKWTREDIRPVVQNLCRKYLSGVDGVDQIMYADLPYLVPGDEEEPLGALGETVEL